jgi:hypothetical protein
MKKTERSYREQGTLIISTQDDVFPAITEIELSDFNLFQSLLYRERNGNFQSLTLKFENYNSSIAVNFNYRFVVEVILVSFDDKVIKIYTERGISSKISNVKLIEGIKIAILAPKGFVKEHGIKTNETSIKLAGSMAYPAVYYQDVWGKELKTKSDGEIIDIYNELAGKGYMGYGGNCQRSALGSEINSRNFDSSLIITLNENKTIKSISYRAKVKLVNNKLEYTED